MSRITLYSKKGWEVLDVIYDAEEYYCINGMFYIKTIGPEYYFALDLIGEIKIDAESEE